MQEPVSELAIMLSLRIINSVQELIFDSSSPLAVGSLGCSPSSELLSFLPIIHFMMRDTQTIISMTAVTNDGRKIGDEAILAQSSPPVS